VEEFPDRLRAPWLGDLVIPDGEPPCWERTQQGLLEADGTLVFVLRSVFPFGNPSVLLDSSKGLIEDRHELMVIGGLAFIPEIHEGFDFTGRDPIRYIEHLCLAIASREYDHSIQGIEEFVAQLEVARRERTKAKEEVVTKARAILEAHLLPEQLEEFRTSNEFHVLGADGFEYLLTEAQQHNVFRIEGGRRTFEYCIVTHGFLPVYDQMLAQKLLLQANPEMFHRITNTWELTEAGERVLQPKGPVEEIEIPRNRFEDLLQFQM
jgi:hypothetical protein